VSTGARYVIAALLVIGAASAALAAENEGDNGNTSSKDDCYYQASVAYTEAVGACASETDWSRHGLCVTAANLAYGLATQKCDSASVFGTSLGTLHHRQSAPGNGNPGGRTFGRGPILSPIRPNRSQR
jgi:hypothetical protein